MIIVCGEDTWQELITISQMWQLTQIQASIALLMSRQQLMRDSEAAKLWLEVTLIELSNIKEEKQPWEVNRKASKML
ncbi:hypothetical protein [Nostoc sp.]